MESLPMSSSPLFISSPSDESTLWPPNDPTSSLPLTPTSSTPLQLTPSQPSSTLPPPLSTQSPAPSSESSTPLFSVQSSEPSSSASFSVPSSSSNASIISSLSALSASSTSVFQSTIIGTSDGQVYTTVVQSTTVLALGTDVTGIGTSGQNKGGSSNVTPQGLLNPYEYYATNPSSTSSSGAVLASSRNAKERDAYARYDGAQQTPLSGSGSRGIAMANPDDNVETGPDFLRGSGSNRGVRSRRSRPCSHRQ